MNQSKLLDLPNELLIEIFQYFDVSQLYVSLYGLSIRLNNLVNKWHSKHLTFNTIETFDFVRQHTDLGQIRSLSISNSNQMVLFKELFNIPGFLRNCQELFIYDIIPLDFIDLVPRLKLFQSLKSLSVIRKVEISYPEVYNNLFNMIICKNIPALKYLRLTVPCRVHFRPSRSSLSLPTPSNNLEQLILNPATSAELSSLFRFLPSLNRVSADSFYFGHLHDFPTKTKITHLKIRVNRSSDATLDNLAVFLAETPQLKSFSLRAFNRHFADGNKWEHIIQKNIPLLKKFQFEFLISEVIDIDKIMTTFQTNFWLNIKQWLVNYDYKASGTKSTRIYTTSQSKQFLLYRCLYDIS
ncbi:unnamed protein product [Adineta ricciae]|uniref:F-box domain-containing protein n=1 Tax=Adineta ricciae TaxID=249248 RepID=A0A816DVS2_ADIRI|nr:unnamed protein product [Adineta ricciae]CAF1642546.1 unnamed protein product [Adineta ricciae]